MEGGAQSSQLPQSSRRNLTPLQSPLGSSLIPRDFLGQRSASRESPTPGAESPGPPLSLLSTPASDVDAHPPSPSASSMSSIANPRSPRPSNTKNPNHISSNREPSLGAAKAKKKKKTSNDEGPKKELDQRKPISTRSASEHSSATLLHDHGNHCYNPSPPSSPITIGDKGRAEPQIAHLALPGDSSVSPPSSTENHQKAPHDSGHVTLAEVQQLIAAAASPEDLIIQLVKEKRHAVSQNGQLWKLVNKQRALLMGLNGDLEHAVKDKEKYRKKLKDLQVQSHDTPARQPSTHKEPAASVLHSQISSPSSIEQNAALRNQASVSTPTKASSIVPHPSPLDPTRCPSPLRPQNQEQGQPPTAVETSKARGNNLMLTPDSEDPHGPVSESPGDPRVSDDASHPPAQADLLTFPATHEQNKNKEPPVVEPQQRDSDRVGNEMSGSLMSSENPKKPPTHAAAARKAPPAPLNLHNAPSKASVPSNASEQNRSTDSRGREGPTRGRRKTREDDDRDREVLVQRAEVRSPSSKSNKSGKSKSKSGSDRQDPTRGATPVANNMTAAGTRQVAVQHPPEVDINAATAPGSIAAVLSPNSQGSNPVSERYLASPPMSPGLPVSPRPSDRPPGSPMPRTPGHGTVSPLSQPTSPRAVGSALLGSPNTPATFAQAATTSGAIPSPKCHQQLPSQPGSPRIQVTQHPSGNSGQYEHRLESQQTPGSPGLQIQTDQSLKSSAYPQLLVIPQALSAIAVSVCSSRLRPKRHSYMGPKSNDEEPVFTLSVFSRSDGKELWRVEKIIRALPQLDQQFRSVTKFEAQLPDRKLFSGHSPAIVDARRTALNQYFRALFEAAVDERSAHVICVFLSSDVIEARDDETSLLNVSQRSKGALALGTDGRPVKEGYLTKRGKNFGGWKARYFVLQGTELKYFESPGGTHLGTIKLQHARIGKQTQNPSPSRTDEDVEYQYRHAFLVLEPKRKDSSSLVRHVLCAESDQERDEWAQVLTHHVEHHSDDERMPQPSKLAKGQRSASDANIKPSSEKVEAWTQDDQAVVPPVTMGGDELKGVGYDRVTAGTAPTMGSQQSLRRQDATPSPTSTSSATNVAQDGGPSHDQHSAAYKTISGPKNGSVIQDVGSWGNKLMSAGHPKDKKRSLWNFRHRAGSDHSGSDPAQSVSQPQYTAVRACFGIPLAEAVELCHPRGVDVLLPAVVYRCIEYLRAKNAASEEGIFRLSGSNITIKSLRERFNTEGDVNLLANDQYYDIHAVASLFKSYLRELPTTVLTKELHLDFLHVSDLEEKGKKIEVFNTLVHRLPKVNLALLRALAEYLIEIVNSAEHNKMNVRNMGIVFSPTLNIPPGVFALFLTEFEGIFGPEVTYPVQASDISEKTIEVHNPGDLTPEDIRSPRHQMFSDLPTPAYNQTSFPQQPAPTQNSVTPLGAQTRTGPAREPNLSQDTGFIPMKPSYETRTYNPDPPVPTQNANHRHSLAPVPLTQRPEYGSMNMMMAPSQSTSLKAKRRESSMLFMGSGGGDSRGSTSKLRETTGLVADNAAFD